ncbi:Neuropeptide-like protein 31 family protein [Teladorsagia circumcincta]|uniref:Neuropeptide-like protein 31 family protein n=1 Tax=Teladorsagia circumcincta TaxID=45464 RepID=A0A2G9TXB2_TELCI|nr:Neuropeptide-like protein 31 family protein [Teladorsagia circumcincta]
MASGFLIFTLLLIATLCTVEAQFGFGRPYGGFGGRGLGGYGGRGLGGFGGRGLGGYGRRGFYG